LNEPSLMSQAEVIFEKVADLPSEEQTRQVALLAGENGPLKELVTRLLRSDAEAASFLQSPAAVSPDFDHPAHGELPISIGKYQVVGLIGEGGMGRVYEATQDNPRRSVAIKVVRPGTTSRETLARFQRESQVLGALQHPGIAAIYEAGVVDIVTASSTLRKQPYFAMELVRGLPLTEYLKRNAPSTRTRLELFALVCDAVDHAHRHGVVHRDLKPGNVLVETGENSSTSAGWSTNVGGPRPKVLDFGVARADSNDDSTLTLRTDAMQLLGTVPYMSPEQISPKPGAPVDPRSDVYALGVMLYEMLSGKLPLNLRGKTIAEAARMVVENDPTSLSAESRDFRGDIETIVSKALEKDPARRYQSAGFLAEDVRRHLRHEPILAHAPTSLYQLQKFAKRNKTIVLATVAVLVALTTGLIVSTRLYLDAQEARGKAEQRGEEATRAGEQLKVALETARQESAKVKAINDYLVNDFIRAASPNRDGPNVKLIDVVERASKNVGETFKDQPQLEASIRVLLADSMGDLDRREEAIAHGRRAVELIDAHVGSKSVLAREATLVLMNELSNHGRHSESEAMAKQWLETFRTEISNRDEQYMRCEGILAECLQVRGAYHEAQKILVDLLPRMEEVLGVNDNDTGATLSSLAAVYVQQKLHDDALRTYRELLKRTMANRPPDPIAILATRLSLMGVLLNTNNAQEAVEQAAQAVEDVTKLVPKEHFMRASVMFAASQVYMNTGDLNKASALAQESYEGMLASRGPADYLCERVSGNLRTIYFRAKNVEEFRRWIPVAFAHRLLLAGDDEGESLKKGYAELVTRQVALGDPDTAADSLVQAAKKFAPPDHPNWARFYLNLARACLMNGRPEEATKAMSTAEAMLSGMADASREVALLEKIRNGDKSVLPHMGDEPK
jgi:eukaryotic-like serine/threonine-protein kinase